MAVGVVEPGGDFGGDPNRVGDGQLGLTVEPGAERFALDVGHDVKDGAFDPARIEQGQDVGVLQVGGGLDLLQERSGPMSAARSVCMTLMATLRLWRGSWARNTEAMPPAPNSCSRR